MAIAASTVVGAGMAALPCFGIAANAPLRPNRASLGSGKLARPMTSGVREYAQEFGILSMLFSLRCIFGGSTGKSVCRIAAFAFIAGDHAVFDVDDAMGILGDVAFMRHQNNGVAL
jgi:hypothetical protein